MINLKGMMLIVNHKNRLIVPNCGSFVTAGNLRHIYLKVVSGSKAESSESKATPRLEISQRNPEVEES